MCGRFAITLPDDAMVRLFAASPANDLPPGPRFNVCPTQPVATVVSRDGQRHLGPMRWGFIPRWYKSPDDGPLLINARAESVAEKRAFAEAARQRRCLVPASGFYEWTKSPDGKRLPWYISRADGAAMAFAGIWQVWDGAGQQQATCAIVTCAASPDIDRIHHRQPVLVEPDDWGLWLGEEGHGAARLMQPLAEGRLRAHRVSTAVNSNRAEGEALIAPNAD